MTQTAHARPLQVGVIGLGWAGQQHMAAYAAHPDVELIAIAGEEPALLADLGDTYGVEHRVASWQEILEVPGLDAVSIAVPTFLHAPIAVAALERGIHVLSEKPIARNGDEGQLMVDAARRAGRVLEVVFNHRLRNDMQALAGIVSRGEIGTPYHARASWMRRRGIPLLGSWFTNQERSGGGPLVDIGVHVLDYALHVLGEPKVVSVTAATYSELGHRGIGGARRQTADQSVSAYEVEDFASVFLRLEGGGTVVLETSWAVFRDPVDLMDIRLFASDGGADLRILLQDAEDVAGDLSVYRDADGEIADERVEVEPGGRAHAGVIADFVDHLRDVDSWPEHDGSIALDRARIIDACYRSAAERREVTL